MVIDNIKIGYPVFISYFIFGEVSVMRMLLSRTDGVVAKTRRLVKQYQGLEEKIASMELKINQLEADLETEKRKNDELNNQIKIIKLARNIGSGEMFEDLKVTELKRKLNEYIREVNTCIEMLND